MQKFIIRVILFLVLMILVNLIYLIIVQTYDWNYSKRLEALNLNNPKNDIIVIGNSLPMDGIDTQYLSGNGFESYNLAIGGSTLKTNLIQLQEYLNLYDYKPKVVILGRGSYLNSDFDSEEINPIVKFTRTNWNSYDITDIPMIKFRWIFKELLKKIVSKPHRDATLVNGQLRLNKTITDNTLLKSENQFQIDKFKTSIVLDSIINLCNTNNIKLIILEMPGFKETRHEIPHTCIVLDKQFNNGFLYDFNNYEIGKLINDNEHWIGSNHLNEKGAKFFTKHILNILKQTSKNEQHCK